MNTGGAIYVSRLMGCDVKNTAGDEIGKLEELIVDAETGHAAYGVVKFAGGFLKADKLFAVPWQAFGLSDDENGLLLDIDKSSVENAVAFEKNSWPNMADKRWGRSVHAFFDATPYWEQHDTGDRAQRQQSSQQDARQDRDYQPVGAGAGRAQSSEDVRSERERYGDEHSSPGYDRTEGEQRSSGDNRPDDDRDRQSRPVP